MSGQKPAVVFHEYVSSCKTANGVVHCVLSPLPMPKWRNVSKDDDKG